MSDSANNDNTPSIEPSENSTNPLARSAPTFAENDSPDRFSRSVPYQGENQEQASGQYTLDAEKKGLPPLHKGGLGRVSKPERVSKTKPDTPSDDTPAYALAYGLFALWGVVLGLFLGWLTWG